MSQSVKGASLLWFPRNMPSFLQAPLVSGGYHSPRLGLAVEGCILCKPQRYSVVPTGMSSCVEDRRGGQLGPSQAVLSDELSLERLVPLFGAQLHVECISVPAMATCHSGAFCPLHVAVLTM